MSINPVCRNAPLNEQFLSPQLDNKFYCFWVRSDEATINTPNNDIVGSLTKCCQVNFSSDKNPLIISGGPEFPDCYQYCLADSKVSPEPTQGLATCLAKALKHATPNPQLACWNPDTKKNTAMISGAYLSWSDLGVVMLAMGAVAVL
ncbi:hypothetical protein BJ875DRAFT_481544 [Amylocarpus encephaloides]|uniref:Uncharacterized protein n=1 Tax=Amylocarpus encephaloides TaxID=45428 RepID=A0A9P8C7W3_9HELO|nr:hypothetical protein BJ875DRAFT_481544 [Amylocarpus encephaloides]